MINLGFPNLPAPKSLILDNPVWVYPSTCGAGSGMARLRVWTTEATHLHLAVVSETGIGASTTNSVTSIHNTLTQALNGPVVILEHWPEQETYGPECLDQLIVTAGQPHWRRIWPTPPVNPNHCDFETWMFHHGGKLLADTASSVDSPIWGPHCLPSEHDTCGREMCRLTGKPDLPCRAQKLGCPYCGAPRESS
ncbi:hypothetical protein [Streptosporangium canum]|uniref:hypothetical protein n=1 Tax=Streptosporangium canum TaxID=324952 RepID=UPI0037AAB44E